MEKLFDIQRIILEQFEQTRFYERALFHEIRLTNPIVGIVGQRGVGKTTRLLHHLIQQGGKNRQALYISADHVYFLDHTLLDLFDQLYKETKVRFVCIDEIQKYPNWNQELKNIADTYKSIKILFSGSSMIDIVHSKYDLSRRVTLYSLPGLSFREYLEFYHGIQCPIVALDEIIQSATDIITNLNIPQPLIHFKEYLRTGYYPFFGEFEHERDKFQAIENAIQKTIYEDIAHLKSLKTPTLILLEKLYKYVINSSPGELSAYKLANTLNKDFASIGEYLHILALAGIIRFLFPNKSGKAALKNPTKMYPDNPNLIYSAYLPQTEDLTLGKVRETFVINQCQNAHLSVYYPDKGDFMINDYLIEVGGKNKTMQQVKNLNNGFVFADGIITGSKHIIPLYLLGFLY